MAEQKKGTIYQNLNQMLNLDGIGFNPQDNNAQKAKIIIKGTSAEEIQRKGLELQQKKELENKFFKTTDRGYQKAMQYEAARLPAYLDYEGFEYYPMVSSALDLFMEESTTIGNNGKMLNIYSSKERIKSHLEELFYDIINVNVNLPFWTRNLVKYGDNFVLIYGQKKEGITHVKQLVNYEIERLERIDKGKPIIKFKERMTGDEFNIFEIAHFRLLGDDKYLPYGSCIAKNSKILTENGYKNIQDIKKDETIYSFDEKTQKKVLSKVLDVVCNGEKQTYKITTQHNFVKATDNHKIFIYDYSDNTFKYKLVSELKVGDGLITNHSDDFNTVSKIDKTVEIKEFHGRTYDTHLDNLSVLPDYINEDFAKFFGFLLGDGNIRVERPSMVYFAYGADEKINEKYVDLAEKLIGKKITLKTSKKHANGISSVVINSKNFAEILQNMRFEGVSTTKRVPDWVFSASKEIKKAFLEGFVDADGSFTTDKWNYVRVQIEISNFELLNDLKTLIQSVGWKSGSINKRKKREKKTIINGIEVKNIADSYQLYFYYSELKQTKVSDIKNRLSDDFIVEKIKSVELDVVDLVYDIYVDNENHNFYANNIVVHNSVLNKVRRVIRQLILAEDAMLTYRLVRAGEKKVFKIDVGNIDEDDVEEYIMRVASKFKKGTNVYPDSGQLDYRFNVLGNDEDYFLPVRNANIQTGIDTLAGACLSLDTKIDLLDGRSLELKNIIDEFNSGKKLWSYGINPVDGEIVPSQITWAGITRKNTEVVKITLDNGESIVTTSDHKFPTKFNGKKEAKDLIVGESLWSFNKKLEKINENNKKYEKDYEMIYDHSINDWVYTHRLVKKFMEEHGVNKTFIFDKTHENYDKKVIHHKSLNRFDNSPENLVSMSYVDHFKYHSHIGYTNFSESDKAERVRKLNEGGKIYWNNLTDEQKKLRGENLSKKRKEKLKSLCPEEYKEYIDRVTASLTSEESRDKMRIVMQTPEYKEKMRINGKKMWENEEIRKKIIINQSFQYNDYLLDYVVDFVNQNGNRLESLIDNINTENNDFKTEFINLNKNKPYYKSFTRFTRKNILKLIRSYGYSNWYDFLEKLPCYNHKIVSIEYLTEKQDVGTITIDGNHEFHDYHTFALSCGVFTYNSNLNDINDIEYLRENLYTGLGIPKPFLSFQDSGGAGKSMAQFDIRFSKKINRIQQAMIQELNKIAIIHLYLLGFDSSDLSDFMLSLTNPSTQQELLKAELFREKAQTYSELTKNEGGIAAMSHTDAKKLLFNMSDKEIIDDLKRQRMERALAQELADTPLTIKKTTIFNDIDQKYGDEAALAGLTPTTGQGQGGGGNSAGGPPSAGGGTPSGGGMPEMGGGTGGGGNEENLQPTGEFPSPANLPPPTGESVKKESENILSEKRYDTILDKMFNSDPEIKKSIESKSVIRETEERNKILNQEATDMIKEIDGMLNISETINKDLNKIKFNISDIENIDFENI